MESIRYKVGPGIGVIAFVAMFVLWDFCHLSSGIPQLFGISIPTNFLRIACATLILSTEVERWNFQNTIDVSYSTVLSVLLLCVASLINQTSENLPSFLLAVRLAHCHSSFWRDYPTHRAASASFFLQSAPYHYYFLSYG